RAAARPTDTERPVGPQRRRLASGKGRRAMTEPLLELIDVHAAYGRIDVLHGVNLRVPRGKVFALLGPNGAGKSTTVQVASGRLVPTSGCPHVAGHHAHGPPPAP